MPSKIVLADDHKIMRDGLRVLLQKSIDMEVVGEAENGRQAIRLVDELHPQVVIMDISMPDLNGIEATRQILARKPSTKVIGLSMHADKRFVIGMFEAGAAAYLLKDCAFEELVQAIHAVIANGTYLCSKISDMVVRDYVSMITKAEPTNLTFREREILQLIAEGRSTKEIAECLQVSVKTVETHRQHVMDKLNIFSVAGLTKYAIRTGITSLDY